MSEGPGHTCSIYWRTQAVKVLQCGLGFVVVELVPVIQTYTSGIYLVRTQH